VRETNACVVSPLARDDDRNEDFVENGLRDSSLADTKSDEDRDNEQLREEIADLKGQLRKAQKDQPASQKSTPLSIRWRRQLLSADAIAALQGRIDESNLEQC